jgi:hypothetical protein
MLWIYVAVAIAIVVVLNVLFVLAFALRTWTVDEDPG